MMRVQIVCLHKGLVDAIVCLPEFKVHACMYYTCVIAECGYTGLPCCVRV